MKLQYLHGDDRVVRIRMTQESQTEVLTRRNTELNAKVNVSESTGRSRMHNKGKKVRFCGAKDHDSVSPLVTVVEASFSLRNRGVALTSYVLNNLSLTSGIRPADVLTYIEDMCARLSSRGRCPFALRGGVTKPSIYLTVEHLPRVSEVRDAWRVYMAKMSEKSLNPAPPLMGARHLARGLLKER